MSVEFARVPLTRLAEALYFVVPEVLIVVVVAWALLFFVKLEQVIREVEKIERWLMLLELLQSDHSCLCNVLSSILFSLLQTCGSRLGHGRLLA